ncbi:unnamed protein product [Moneuplotes crassus]|uniref:Uncharacterized protein n=1 Tax=Euplotes crassus TaxID=5936 RepID=A0AAD1XW84_EUPCR|nr:unnamed protein product [Moneuplotes crassus]
MKSGNTCLFYIFAFLNFLLLIIALAVGGSGIYLWVVTHSINIFSISFMGAGVFILLLAVCSFCLRHSTFRLSIYCFILLILSSIMVAALVGFLVKREQVLDWASDHIKEEKDSEAWKEARERIEDNVDISKYILIATTAVTVLVLLFGMFYRCSVSSNKSDHYQTMRHQQRYDKVSGEIHTAQLRREEKQRLYAEKYGLSSVNNNQML